MKNLSILMLFFSFLTASSQITLEHTYGIGSLTRVKLEYSGEKYYSYNGTTTELKFYNSDHTFWKTISLPALPQFQFFCSQIISVSEAEINPDANIEVIFTNYSSSSVYSVVVYSENGTTLLTASNAAEARIDKIAGLPTKFITYNSSSNPNPNSKVYSFPQLILENTYPIYKVQRVKLENSGEKYYLLDKSAGQAKIFNSDHSIWKTINLPKPTATNYDKINFISETKINTDPLLELSYTYVFNPSGNQTSFESKIINENNDVLLTAPLTSSMEINVLPGCQDKLIVYNYIYNNGYSYFSTDIYQLPNLVFEHNYSEYISRTVLENSGEKYFPSYLIDYGNVGILSGNIYNSNHTLWKTISFIPFPNMLFINRVNSITISESKINPDSLLELSFTEVSSELESTFNSYVIQENGTILLNVPNAPYIYLSELPNCQNKIIAQYGSGQFSQWTSSNVYGFGTFSAENFSNSINSIYPNPSNSIVTINFPNAQIKEVNIYNINGILVKHLNETNINKIDVQNLTTGIYIIDLIDQNDSKTSHKLIKS